MEEHDVHEDNKKNKNAVASAAIAGVSEQVFHPYETIIRRMQNYPARINSVPSFTQAVFLGNKPFIPGVTSLMDGFWLAAGYKFLSRTYKFGSQPFLEHKLDVAFKPYLQGLRESHQKGLAGGTSGALLGFGEVLALHPLDTLKIQRQNGNKIPFFDLIKQGKSLYNGMGSALSRNIPGSFIMFGVRSEVLSALEKKNPPNTSLSFSQHAVAALAGAAAAVVLTNPQDVIKTRAQTRTTRVSDFSLFKQVIAKEGLSALAKGIPAKLFQAGPRFALPLLITSYLPQKWRDKEHNQEKVKETKKPSL